MSNIYLDDPLALQKLNIKLSNLELEKKYWKDLKPEKRTFQHENDNMRRSFMLPLCNANIRSVKEKIKKVLSLQDENKQLIRSYFWKNGKKIFKYTEEDQKDDQ